MFISIPVECLKTNMVLGETIYNDSLVPLIERNKKITNKVIKKIKSIKSKDFLVKILPSSKEKIYKETKKEINELVEKKGTKMMNSVLNADELDDFKSFVNDIIDLVLTGDILISLENIKYVNQVTYNHALSVMVNCIIFAKKLDLSKKAIEELAIAAALHDLGKILVNQDFLNKEGPLSDEERDDIKKHPQLAVEFLEKNYDLSDDILKGIGQHHEKLDGSGYPDGLKGDEIHKYAKIIGLVDVYDALLQKRSYKESCEPSEVLEYLYGASHLFEYSLITSFVNTIAFYHVGERVLLSSGVEGEIVEIQFPVSHKPVVKTIKGLIDLRKSKNIVIKKVID